MATTVNVDVIERAARGERAALSELVMIARPLIERQLLRYPVSDEDRRDLCQATLMQIVRRLDSFRGEANFSTWLFRVTANEALMLMRSQRRQRMKFIDGVDEELLAEMPSTPVGEPNLFDDAMSTRQRDAKVRYALADLPDDYRNVVVAHYHLDLGLQEIADRFSLSESAVRSRLHRARCRLRDVLEAPEGVHQSEAFAMAAE
jgi:RNA polymerase sigma-70 factor, ECF subfamily